METKKRTDSVDSRSHSFDSTDSKIKIIIKKVSKKNEYETKIWIIDLSHPDLIEIYIFLK